MTTRKVEESRDGNRRLRVFVSERERARDRNARRGHPACRCPPVSEISGLDFSRTRPWIRKPFWPS